MIELTAVVIHDWFKPFDLPPGQNPPSSCLTWKQHISVINLGISIIVIIIIPVGTWITKQCQTQCLRIKISSQLK